VIDIGADYLCRDWDRNICNNHRRFLSPDRGTEIKTDLTIIQKIEYDKMVWLLSQILLFRKTWRYKKHIVTHLFYTSDSKSKICISCFLI